MKSTRFIFVVLIFYIVACDAPHKTPRVNDSTSAGMMADEDNLPQSHMTSSPPSSPSDPIDHMDPLDSSDTPISMNPDPEPDPPAPLPPEECQTNEAFFEEDVWRPILKPLCLDCHNPQGAAQGSDMVYVPEEQFNSLQSNYEAFKDIASFDQNGEPVVFLKPTAQMPHGGGFLFEPDSSEAETLLAMIQRTRNPNPVVCEDEMESDDHLFFEDLTLLGPHETLYKAALVLAGRLPTTEEEEQVSDFGWGGVEASLNQLMESEGFYTRLKEIWNDVLLTDKYLGRNNALDLLSGQYYPHARWFLGEGIDQQDPFYWAARDYSNQSLAREPLEHIAYVVRNHRPFSEIITADYIAMNPFTARAYGNTDLEWEDPLDPREYQAGRIPNRAHAGILSSPMFLNRFPTTDTNRNRHRARIFFKLFLDLDVFKLAERPIDPTSTAHNPTMNDPQCSICHTVVDPVAGAFQHWDDQGSFAYRETWYGDMRAPGFGQELLPFEERGESLRWLAVRASQEHGFDRAMVRMMYKALIGGDLLSSPTEGDFFEERTLAFEKQQHFVNEIATGFRVNQHQIRWLIKALIRSPYFRAKGLKPQRVQETQQNGSFEALLAQFQHLGHATPLSPEQLNRKLYAVAGAKWRPNANHPDYLLDTNAYRLLYGGIDSDDIVERITTPNGIFANIQRRMANEFACKITAYDFTRSPEERFLFPLVEPSFIPEDSNGFPIPQAQELIRLNLQHLAWRLWGVRLETDDPELEALFNVFVDVWRIGQDSLVSETSSVHLPGPCQGRWDLRTGQELPQDIRIYTDPSYSLRAWEAVLSLFLNDYKFLYP